MRKLCCKRWHKRKRYVWKELRWSSVTYAQECPLNFFSTEDKSLSEIISVKKFVEFCKWVDLNLTWSPCIYSEFCKYCWIKIMYSDIKFINCASCLLLRIFFSFVTAHKRSCGKVMFLHLSVSHSVHGGGGRVCHTHTPAMHAPWHVHPLAHMPPWHAHPLLHMPPPCHACPPATPVPCHAHSPAIHAPCHACPHDMRSMSGRYASYLNAFLFQNADVRYIR